MTYNQLLGTKIWIGIDSELMERAQMALFALGFTWGDGSQGVSYPNERAIYISTSGTLTVGTAGFYPNSASTVRVKDLLQDSIPTPPPPNFRVKIHTKLDFYDRWRNNRGQLVDDRDYNIICHTQEQIDHCVQDLLSVFPGSDIYKNPSKLENNPDGVYVRWGCGGRADKKYAITKDTYSMNGVSKDFTDIFESVTDDKSPRSVGLHTAAVTEDTSFFKPSNPDDLPPGNHIFVSEIESIIITSKPTSNVIQVPA